MRTSERLNCYGSIIRGGESGRRRNSLQGPSAPRSSAPQYVSSKGVVDGDNFSNGVTSGSFLILSILSSYFATHGAGTPCCETKENMGM